VATTLRSFQELHKVLPLSIRILLTHCLHLLLCKKEVNLWGTQLVGSLPDSPCICASDRTSHNHLSTAVVISRPRCWWLPPWVLLWNAGCPLLPGVTHCALLKGIQALGTAVREEFMCNRASRYRERAVAFRNNWCHLHYERLPEPQFLNGTSRPVA